MDNEFELAIPSECSASPISRRNGRNFWELLESYVCFVELSEDNVLRELWIGLLESIDSDDVVVTSSFLVELVFESCFLCVICKLIAVTFDRIVLLETLEGNYFIV